MAKFLPGQSGNPGGRPKKDTGLQYNAREFTKEALERLVFWMRSDDARASFGAACAILDRGWGKPVQQIEGDLANIIVNVIRYDPQVIDAVSREIAADTARIEAAE